MPNDAKHFQPSGIHTFKSLKTMLQSPLAIGTSILLFNIQQVFQNGWSTQFALLVQLFFTREFPLHWHLIHVAVGRNAAGNASTQCQILAVFLLYLIKKVHSIQKHSKNVDMVQCRLRAGSVQTWALVIQSKINFLNSLFI